MLTEQEKKELDYDNLSYALKRKLDAVFQSPYFNAVLALSIQKKTLEEEMINNPFTIRGNLQLELTEEGVKKAISEAVTARQNTETAIKVAKWLQEAAEDIEKLQAKLTTEEKAELKDTMQILSGAAEEVRNNVRKKHGIKD